MYHFFPSLQSRVSSRSSRLLRVVELQVCPPRQQSQQPVAGRRRGVEAGGDPGRLLALGAAEAERREPRAHRPAQAAGGQGVDEHGQAEGGDHDTEEHQEEGNHRDEEEGDSSGAQDETRYLNSLQDPNLKIIFVGISDEDL